MSIPGVDETAVEEILRRIVTALEAADLTEAKSCLRILDELKKHGAALGDDRVRETVNALEDCQAYLGVDESGAAHESAARALDEWIRRR